MDSSKDSDVVHFFGVPGAYLPGQDIHARYQIQEAYNVHARDWIGLFRVGWTSKRDYYTFEWAPAEKEDGQCVAKFLGSRLPHEDGNFYQFCYVSRDGDVRGSSRPFQFSKSARTSASDDVEMVEVDEDSSLVLLRSRADAQVMELEKKIAELTQKNVNVEDSFVQVQTECQGAKDERDQASAELTACKEQLRLREEQLQQREKEILELKQTTAEATNKLKDVQEINDQIEQALQATTVENSQLQQLLAANEKTKDEQIDALTAANKTLAAQKEESETELRMQCANLEEQLRNVNEEKEIAKSRNEYYVADNERLDQCVQDQKAQVATLEQEVTEQQQTIAEQKEEIAKKQEKITEQQEIIAALEYEKNAVTEQLEKEKANAEAVREALQSKEHDLNIVQENMCEVMGNIKEPRDMLPKLSADDTVDKSVYVALQRAYDDVEVRWKKDERLIVQLKDKVAELEERVKRCQKEYVAVVSEIKALKKGSQQLGSEGNAVDLEEKVQNLEEELRAFQEKHDQRIADKNDRLQQQQEVLDEKLTEVKGLQDQQKAMQTLIDTLNKENGQLKHQVLQIREENGRHYHHQHRSPGAPRRPPPVQTGAPVPQQAPANSSTTCPVCQVRFPRTTNQVEIERHVNAHFDA